MKAYILYDLVLIFVGFLFQAEFCICFGIVNFFHDLFLALYGRLD